MAIELTRAKIRALTQMAEGGEAIIYEYPGDRVLKLFKDGVNIANKEQKVHRLIKGRLPQEVVGPLDSVLVNRRFVGYVMQKVKEAEIIHQYSKNRYITLIGFSNRDVLEVVTAMGKSLDILHGIDVVIGDISDYNALVKGKGIVLIDSDSWGIGHLPPDAFTPTFTAPECYQNDQVSRLSKESDLFSYAVLAFKTLARIHPFNGTLKRDESMSTVDRIRNGISILGKEDITIPKMVPSWEWMSPDLKAIFLDIFEKGKRVNVYELLEDQLQHSKLCSVHNIYYYSKFSECPICSGKAKLITAPKLVRVDTTGGIAVVVVFEAADLKVLLNKRCYLNQGNEMVHIGTKRKVTFSKGTRVDFTEDGRFAFIADDDTVQIINSRGNQKGVLERRYKTSCLVRGQDLYYVDRANWLTKLSVSDKGHRPTSILQVYNPLYTVADGGEIFTVSLYPKRAIITANNHTFQVDYTGKVQEYAMKYDKATKRWLFVYQLLNGKYRTMVFGNGKIEYDSDMLMYNAQPLSGICFANSTIYDPGSGKITGTNYLKNRAAEFACAVVDESSMLEFDNDQFTIVTDQKIYRFG